MYDNKDLMKQLILKILVNSLLGAAGSIAAVIIQQVSQNSVDPVTAIATGATTSAAVGERVQRFFEAFSA